MQIMNQTNGKSYRRPVKLGKIYSYTRYIGYKIQVDYFVHFRLKFQANLVSVAFQSGHKDLTSTFHILCLVLLQASKDGCLTNLCHRQGDGKNSGTNIKAEVRLAGIGLLVRSIRVYNACMRHKQLDSCGRKLFCLDWQRMVLSE